MGHEWTVFLQEQVQTRRYVPFPAAAREVVGVDHEVHGPSVYWNYERNANYVVLSNYALRDPSYVDVGRYKIYDVEADDGAGGRIRVPEGLDAVVRSNFLEGTRVVYLAHREMVESDDPTLYLLSNAQFRNLLPRQVRETAADGDAAMREALFDLPEFLSSP